MENECDCPEHCTAHEGVIIKMESIDKWLDRLENNHLAHIYSRLNGINRWLIGILVTFSVFLLGVIANLAYLLANANN